MSWWTSFSLLKLVPSQGKGRSNYRLDPSGVVAARGYGADMYCRAKVCWDTTREGDSDYAELSFDDAPIAHESLTNIILGLNNGTIPDRFA
jgi:hypothetical protein